MLLSCFARGLLSLWEVAPHSGCLLLISLLLARDLLLLLAAVPHHTAYLGKARGVSVFNLSGIHQVPSVEGFSAWKCISRIVDT